MNQSSSTNSTQLPPTNVSSATLGPNAQFSEGTLGVYLLPAVVLGVFALCAFAEVWARKKDRRDRCMVGATVIPQKQHHRSPHNYMLQFYTGSGRHDGTTANVYCCLHGNKRQTKPVVLRDPNRLLFQRGTLSSFLVTFNHSLDQIKRIHIWHDIAGPDPPWFLERVVVCHMNTGLTWYFEANRWLDVSQGDGTVECILEPETRKSLLGAKRLFDRQLADNFRNKHMWFSSFLVKERTRFSRSQRVRCLMCLIGISLLAVSVVFRLTRNLAIFPSGMFRLGPLKLSLEDIVKAVACSCMAFPCRVLLESLMRKSKRRSELCPGETDVRGHLSYCKDMAEKVVLLDGMTGNTAVPSGNGGQDSIAGIERRAANAANKAISEGTVADGSSVAVQEEHDTQNEQWDETLQANRGAIESARGDELQGHVTDISDEGYMKTFTKKSYPSVKRMLERQIDSVVKASVPEGRRDSITSTIDFQLFCEKTLSPSDGDDERLSHSSGDAKDFLTIDDIKIVQGECEVNGTLPTGKPLELKNNGRISGYMDSLPNGLGCSQLEGGEPGNRGNLDNGHADRTEGESGNPLPGEPKNGTPRKRFLKSVGNSPGKRSKRKSAYIVEEPFDERSGLKTATSQGDPRTVHNIDNAPRLWKALPFPREHVDKHSLKKVHENSVYRFSHAWLTVSSLLCAIVPLAAAAVTVTFSQSWSHEVVMSWLMAVALTIVIQSVIMETLFLFTHALYSAFWHRRPLDELNLVHELMNIVSLDNDYDGDYFVDDLNDWDRELIPRPPTEEERREAREKAGRDRELEQVLVMIVFDVLFLLLLLIIGLGNRDLYSFPMRTTMVNTFNPSERFMKITNIEKFWLWTKRDLITGVYDVHNKNFLSDKCNSLLGTPILRQKRLRMGGTCRLPSGDIANAFDECRARFVEEESEDQSNYRAGWASNLTRLESSDNSASQWSYHTDSESHTRYTFTGRVTTHEGGGYIAKLGFEKNSALLLLDDLQANRWIDWYTRVVVFEMSTYNANVNILSVLSLSVEFTPSNGALPRIDIFTFRLYRYLTASQLIFLVCEGIFVAFVVQLIYRTIGIIALEGKAYFASAWNYSDLLLIFFSLATIGLYGSRANKLAEAIKSIQKDSSVFYGFYAIAVSDNLVAYMSCLVFLVPTVQFLKFLKFNKDFMVFYSTLERIRSDLGGFMIIMSISLFIFSFWAFVMLRTREENYATFFSVVGNMVSLIMGSFNFRIMSESQDLGPLFTYTFTGVNMFILLNIVLCIISIGFRASRHDERFQKSEYEVVAFIVYTIKGALGLLPPYIPPPPKIVPPEVPYISQQWILNTLYITQSQVHRLGDFSDRSYCEDFLDDFQGLLCASGLAYDDHYALELLQKSVMSFSAEENKKAPLVAVGDTIEGDDPPMQNQLDVSVEDVTHDWAAPVAPLKPARPAPKSYKYSLRRQLFEESLRNTRRKSLPAMSDGVECGGGEHEDTSQEGVCDSQEEHKPGETSVSEANTSRDGDAFTPRAIERSISEYSLSRQRLQSEALKKYRLVVENELSCGARQVFVKSSTCSPRPENRGLEQRRWSIEIEEPSTLTRDEDQSRAPTPEVPRAELAARWARYRKPPAPDATKTKRKLTNGSLPLKGLCAGQTCVVPEPKVVEVDTIHSVIADMFPGVTSDRNRRRRHSEVLREPEEFLRLLTMPLGNDQKS